MNCQGGLHGNCTRNDCRCPCVEGDIPKFALTLMGVEVKEHA